MTLRDIVDAGINIEGWRKIQCWEDYDNPTIYHEGYDNGKSLREYMDREVAYIFPYAVSDCESGICIELAQED